MLNKPRFSNQKTHSEKRNILKIQRNKCILKIKKGQSTKQST